MTVTTNEADMKVFRRYAGLSLPRHVSYPMPTWWHKMDASEARSMYRESDRQKPGYDLSLYLHIPFCEALCKFCACNKVIQRKNAPGAAERIERYLAAMESEIRQLAASLAHDRPVRQVHYGGGSPTYLSNDQITRIHQTVLDAFRLSPGAEVAMEIDPRNVSAESLRRLRQLGFNRVSLGVQDFDDQVQKHVRRIQTYETVSNVMAACRELRFDSINFDLIYGLPYQTPETIRDTVEKTITLSPDRIAYYHYAQVPEKIATQRGIDHTKLPDSETKLEMFLIGWKSFEEAGYQFIGLDHFARPDESLSKALEDGTIQRNFQGMATGGGSCLLGVGASAISHLPNVGFLQNIKDADRYIICHEQGKSLVERGKRLSFDDRVRQAVINQLYCTAQIQPTTIEACFDIRFAGYFAREMQLINEMERDRLVTKNGSPGFRLTRPLGRVLMRNVAAVFDAYLNAEAYRKGEQVCFSSNA